MAEKITLTKQDRKKVWWRHQFLQGSWNYERMQMVDGAIQLFLQSKNYILTRKIKLLL